MEEYGSKRRGKGTPSHREMEGKSAEELPTEGRPLRNDAWQPPSRPGTEENYRIELCHHAPAFASTAMSTLPANRTARSWRSSLFRFTDSSTQIVGGARGVAGELLGRYLREDESMHHHYRVHDDRPEIPGLSRTQQPSGIRARGALLGHAPSSTARVGARSPPRVLTVSPEHPWRWRESNPPPSERRFAGRGCPTAADLP